MGIDGITTGPVMVMQAQWDKWAQLWGHQQQHSPLAAWPDTGQLAHIKVEEIRAAAKSFRQGTCAIDGWHPRVFGLFSDRCLAALAELLVLMEGLGWWPDGKH